MACTSCSRRVLNAFIRSFAPIRSSNPLQYTHSPVAQYSRFHSAAPRLEGLRVLPDTDKRSSKRRSRPTPKKPQSENATSKAAQKPSEPKPKKRRLEQWQVQKAIVKEKLGGEAWNPRKKLSPDTVEGIRHLNQTQPERFTTGVLADHFKVSPDAIRRILKSKWRPSDEEHEDRLRRWDKRGEKIWSNLVELGVKPPKKWRDMGVGKATAGQVPKWKSRSRNRVAVNDLGNEIESSIIPIVDGHTGETQSSRHPESSVADRL